MALRRRQRRQPSSETAEAVKPEDILDEDDQEQVVQNIQQSIADQQKRIFLIFQGLCLSCALTSLLVSAAVERREAAAINNFEKPSSAVTRTVRWTHTVVACLLYERACHIADHRSMIKPLGSLTVYFPIALGFVFAAVSLMIARNDADKEESGYGNVHFHQGLVIANSLTLAAAAFTRWENRSADQALQELKEAKYPHKSI